LKLLVDKRLHRVLYAKAHKDAVDFLIGLLRVRLVRRGRCRSPHAPRPRCSRFLLLESPGPDRRFPPPTAANAALPPAPAAHRRLLPLARRLSRCNCALPLTAAPPPAPAALARYLPRRRRQPLALGLGTCHRHRGRARRLHGGEPRHAAPLVAAALAEERIREESTEGEEKKREKSAADMWAARNFLFFF
ncbi:Os01g0597701, partial [Oryza sativa Japonica Group]